MLKSSFVEDIFLEFVSLCDNKNIQLQHQDQSAANSFFVVLSTNGQLTKNQANFIIKILQKYKMYAKLAGLDYSLFLENPEWRTDFRILDMARKIFVEKDEDGEVWICAKEVTRNDRIIVFGSFFTVADIMKIIS
jgi:folylpolyglutamate synthase/dihydropteroate synthase